MRKIFILGGLAMCMTAFAADVQRPEAVISLDYTGNRKLDFPPLADHVRLRVRQAPRDIASRLGLVQFNDGFQYPLTIRFVDKVRLSDQEFEPRDLDNAPALLRFVPDHDGNYRQDLTLDANVYFERPREFDRILDRQLAFIVLNEAMGPSSLDLPNWVRQGLATYVAGTGDELLKRAAREELGESNTQQNSKPRVVQHPHLQDLDGPFSARSQVQYYLAIQYIQTQGGLDGLQNFVRNIVGGKSVSDSLDQAISMDLDTFKQNVHTYSTGILDDLTHA